MRLAAWSLRFYRLPYEREVVWSNAREDAGVYALLRLVADDGSSGITEGTVKDTWSGVSPRSLAAAMEDLVIPAVRALDLADEGALAAALARIPENRLAKGMVQSACWTLRAAAAGRPLWRLWDGREQVPLCWTVTRDRPARMAAEAAQYCGRYGFRVLKVKGGQGVDVDLQALAEIRAAVGDGVALYVDANSAYPRAAALEYVQRIAAAGAEIAEDPCPLLPDAEFERLQRECGIPVLIDSSCTSVRDARLYLERGARAISLKPGRVGLSEARAIGELAAATGAQTAVGIYAESALGTLLNLQLPAPLPAEQSFFLILRAQVLKRAPAIREGRLELPQEADLSALIDWDAVERYQQMGTDPISRNCT